MRWPVIYVLRAVPKAWPSSRSCSTTVHDIEVLVVPDARWHEAERAWRSRPDCANAWATTSASPCALVEAIAPEASGKHRYVVSHVPLSGGLERGRSRMPINQRDTTT